LDNSQQKTILEYQSQLLAWNKTHNLVSKSQIKLIPDHIEDSLLIGKTLKDFIVDLGSGGGLPGIPLAIRYPNKHFCLVESNTKKSSFLLNTTSRLNLENTTVLNKRIEDIGSGRSTRRVRYCLQGSWSDRFNYIFHKKTPTTPRRQLEANENL